MKFLSVLLLLLAALPPLGAAEPLRVAVGVPPLAGLTRRIGGDRIAVLTALPPGRSPHDYAPSPKDVRELTRCKLFLHTELPFEHNLVRMLTTAGVRTVELGKKIHRLALELDDGHRQAEEHHDHGHSDPHIWLAVANLKMMAPEIAAELIRLDPAGKPEFERNLRRLEQDLDQLDAELKAKLGRYAGRAFMVHHAAFGYFAHERNLRQLAVELGGREPSPRHLAQVAKQTRTEGVKVIFVQPQFNPGAARALAEATGARVAELDPLDADVLGMLRGLGETLREAMK